MFGKVKNYLIVRPRLVYLLVGLSYLALTFYYMTPSLTHCGTTVYGFGDNTGGVIWRHQVSPNSPLWGFEKVTNYPFGEHLNNPINYSGLLQYSWYFVLAKVAGPICGFNAFNAIGFISAALIMYGFVWRLTRRHTIAWLAGYAVSFTPYFQYKVGGHPSYGYEALLIGVIWAAYELIRGPTKLKAAVLGALVAACFYWDPYFILLGLTALIPFALASLIYRYYYGRPKLIQFKVALRGLLAAAAVAAVLIAPLAIIRIVNASAIDSYVNGARGDPLSDMEHCSNLPYYYLLPASDQYYVQRYVGPRYNQIIRNLHLGCNQSEFNVGLSWAIMLTVVAGLFVFIWEKANGRRLFKRKTSFDYKELTWAFGAVFIFAALMGLPPIVGSLRFPSFVVYKLTTTWRILGREYIVVNIGLVLLFSIVLRYIYSFRPIAHRYRFLLYLVMFLSILVQYQAFKPFTGSAANFRYKEDVPQTIFWLRDQTSIKTVAAYPLDKDGEGVGASIYLTYEGIDKKAYLNSVLPNSPQEPIRFGIRDLTAPQTVPVLRQLGIDAVEVHFLDKDKITSLPGLELVRYENFVSAITNGQIAIEKIVPGPKLDYVITPLAKFPYNGTIMVSAIENQYEAQNGATLKVQNLLTNKTGSVPACFDLKTASVGDHDIVKFMVNGHQVAEPLPINDQYQRINLTLNRGDTLTLMNNTGHDMRLTRLGCQVE